MKFLTPAWILMCAAGAVLAQPSAHEFMTVRSTIGSGGQSVGGSYDLSGTVGQPDASPQTAVGGEFSVMGGFWAAGANPPAELLFADGFEERRAQSTRFPPAK